MPSLWTFFLLLFHPIFTSTLTCNKTDNCKCYIGTVTEIQCPVIYNDTKIDRIIMHVEEKETIKIDCYQFKRFRLDLLPNVTIPEAKRLEMTDCPIPPKNFKQILDHFSMSKVKVLQFEKSSENVSLTKECFEGFSDFERLKFNRLNFTHLDPNVFSMTPNLYSLEMEHNRNLTLVSGLFRDLTNLSALYLGDNGLEHLPDGVFDGLGSLHTLHLWGNKLKVINGTTFSNLKSLSSLELNSNNIEAISENSFRSLSQLTEINLSGNRLTTISSNIFRNNKNIIIYFMFNPDLQPPDYLFANLRSLQEVDLSYCNLSFIPEHIFENSTNLTNLSLRKNKLSYLSPVSLQNLINLKNLDLAENLLTSVDEDIFRDLTSLEKIDLQRNRITTVDNRAFSNKKSLKAINLSHNQYSVDRRSNSILQECPNVKKLDLSYNLIARVEDVISPLHLQDLERLDLGNNLITEIQLTHLQKSTKEMYVNLDNNQITRISFKDVDLVSGSGTTTLSLANNPLRCDCHSYELFQFLNKQIYKDKMFEISTENLICDSPEYLQGQDFAKLSPLQLKCSVEDPICPSLCVCTFYPYSASVLMDCSFKNLTELPTFNHKIGTWFKFNQTEMNLQGNSLVEGPGKDLKGYDNVTRLDLSNNKIRRMEWVPPKVKDLYLHNNALSSLNYETFKTLTSSPLVNLTLGHNPWSCDCDTVNFTNFLREHSKLIDITNIKCYKNNVLLVNLSEKELCPDKLVPFMVVPLLATFLLITTLLVLFYRYQEEIKIWLWYHNLCQCCIPEEDLDKNKTYDAFISYSQKDEDFVVQSLVPNLEGGQRPYKLCLHYRDWIPGEMITTQITNSVLHSRRTLVVLSKNFLESVWGKMEFRTAHTHAMTEGRARVIIVLYGEVEIDKLDEELKSYLKTNTYVKWGDPYFWSKLKYALPHSKRKVRNSDQKMANVMKCIEDKFTSVNEVKSSPGTTPSIHPLDCNALKKHQLSFVQCQEKSTPPAEAGTLIVSSRC